ncbi:MAG: superoxide dismutase [Planctomycetes bacterium RBG_13_46_10]|nr:MAG: superoxide dismutase [Planctomycetes bacterium RBG_13_46_10]
MKKLNKTILLAVVLCALLLFIALPMALSHCEIPCGIYDDPMRLNMLAEHITTIEKSIKEIQHLSSEGDKNYNQLVRWIVNKENHADYFSEIVTQYFMTQRIIPAEENDQKAYKEYVNKITLLHKMLVYAMKCKQTTDLQNVEQLKNLLAQFRAAYLGTGS